MPLNTEYDCPSVIMHLFEEVGSVAKEDIGEYDPTTQTWSHRNSNQLSPVKHNQES